MKSGWPDLSETMFPTFAVTSRCVTSSWASSKGCDEY